MTLISARAIQVLRGVAAVAAVVIVAACVQAPEKGRTKYANIPPAPLPAYRPGDIFVYSNGTPNAVTRRVVRVRGDTVDWVTETGYAFTEYRNFLMPQLAWDGKSSSGRMVNSVDSNLLWPLAYKNEAALTAIYERTDKATKVISTRVENWSCKVNRARPVSVPAGTFNAYKVICDRKSDAGKRTRRHIWYYAPDVGHYVKRVKDYGKREDQVLELVSVKRVAG